MDDLKHIQNEHDILSTLEHLSAEEKTIEEEIGGLLGTEPELEQLVSSLVKHMSNISLIESDAERLSNLMSFTSKMADNVSYKIKSFDLVKNRVASCLKQVEDIIDLRSCTEGIQKALMSEDYEVAARHIYRFLSMDESMLRKSAMEDNGGVDLPDSCSLEQSFVKLHEAEQKLKTIVMTRFDEAARQQDAASVERFFKIFPLINQHREGLDKFSHYLWQQIIQELESKKTMVNAPSQGALVLSKLSQLFETIAQKIDVHYPLIETYYGPGNLLYVVKVLQTNCDQQAKSTISNFKNDKSFTVLVNSVSRALKSTSNVVTNKVDPKTVDKHLVDMMYIINRSQTYLNFISGRLIADIDAASNNQQLDRSDRKEHSPQPEVDRSQVDSLVRDCTLTQVIHDLNSIYVLLEEYFLKESIMKAIQLDVVDVDPKNIDSAITSSMLDDIFFIIKKCLKRSVSCGSINVILAMINHCVMVLETIFYEVITERIKCGYPNTLSTLDLANAYNALQAGRYLQSSSDVEKMRVSFITSLNNLDVAGEYIIKLSDTVTEDVTRSGILQKSQQELFESCLSNFSAMGNKFRLLITAGMQQLFVSVFKSPVKIMIDAFTSTSHMLRNEDILAYEVNDGLRSFMQSFMVTLSSLINSFRKQLTEKNFNILIGVTSGEISNRFYKALFKCTFNKFGGYQLDREVRALTNYLSSVSPNSLREYFSKLKFICVILTLESIEEINEYLNSEGNYTALRINPNELHQLLRLYTELSPLDIRKIKI